MSNGPTSLIDQISSSQAGKEIVANALFDAASPAMIWGRRASTCAGLTWGYFGGWYNGQQISDGTVALTASLTNYVSADPVTGAVSANTTAFPANSIPLYSIVAGATTVTSYTDERDVKPNVNSLLSKSVAGSSNVTLAAYEAKADIMEFTGALTGNIQVIVPLNVKQWTIANKTTGAFTLTVIGATGTGVAVGQSKRCILYADGTNVNRVTADT